MEHVKNIVDPTGKLEFGDPNIASPAQNPNNIERKKVFIFLGASFNKLSSVIFRVKTFQEARFQQIEILLNHFLV